MIELLRAAAEEAPHRVALARPAGVLTYGELVGRAETAAAALRARGVQRLAVLDPDHATVWALLAACSLAGVESCLYPVAATDETVAELRARLGHELLVTPRDLPGPGLVRPDELWSGTELDSGPVPEGPRPLLVLTSGTTSGKPQAARHDWSRILRVTLRIRPAPEQRWLLAYAPNQFAGLQMLLHVAAARATLVAGTSFQPRDGLDAIRRFGVTHASGTPTFWRFLLAELRADAERAPRLEQVTLGGEAVPSAVVEALRETFPGANISQLYAATEMGLSISVRDGAAGLPVSVLDESDGEAQFRIVDGELWVRSRSSMIGYYDDEPVPDDGWRASGDLVEVVGDRIQFRGRATEVINVGGVKVHPLPIEERVARIPGVALAHAHGRPNALVGQVVALDVVLTEGVDTESVDSAIREEFAEDPAAHRPRSITFVETLDTHGGKLLRGRTP
jgi:acyl-CoA synthetase (AMP-forming)/AMP-acid ligase II